jgi:hypothetical protein
MTDIPHEIGLRFGALAPSLSEQIIAQIPDIARLMGQKQWKEKTSKWEEDKKNILRLLFGGLITDSERDKIMTRLNKSIVRELKKACFGKRKKANGGDPA